MDSVVANRWPSAAPDRVGSSIEQAPSLPAAKPTKRRHDTRLSGGKTKQVTRSGGCPAVSPWG